MISTQQLLEVKWTRREADHLPLSTAEVKNTWSYTSNPPVRIHGVGLKEIINMSSRVVFS